MNTAQILASFKQSGLGSKIFYTFLVLAIYRFGSFLPIPGVDPIAMSDMIESSGSGILTMLNAFSGGALSRMSIFSLTIMPYITASIVMQLLSFSTSYFEKLRAEGVSGQRKIAQYTQYLTIILSIVQGLGIATNLESMGPDIVTNPSTMFYVSAVTCLLGGTMFLVWLGERINIYGLGNGISIIVFAGVVSSFPSVFGSMFAMGQNGSLSPIFIILFLFLIVFIIMAIVFIESSQRKIFVQYPRRSNTSYSDDRSVIPLKINGAGVIPPIFASALLMFPLVIIDFVGLNEESSETMRFIAESFSRGGLLYILLYALSIGFFCFFYTAIISNPDETAENLRKGGAVIPGIRPGKDTAKYIDNIMSKITVFGAIYLVLVCTVPEFLIAEYSLPFYLGGAGLLIVVNVVVDTITQANMQIMSYQYRGLTKKGKRKA